MIDQRFPEICGPRSVWTNGTHQGRDPGEKSIIPGRAEALFQLRDTDPIVLDRLGTSISNDRARRLNEGGHCRLAVERLSASQRPP